MAAPAPKPMEGWYRLRERCLQGPSPKKVWPEMEEDVPDPTKRLLNEDKIKGMVVLESCALRLHHDLVKYYDETWFPLKEKDLVDLDRQTRFETRLRLNTSPDPYRVDAFKVVSRHSETLFFAVFGFCSYRVLTPVADCLVDCVTQIVKDKRMDRKTVYQNLELIARAMDLICKDGEVLETNCRTICESLGVEYMEEIGEVAQPEPAEVAPHIFGPAKRQEIAAQLLQLSLEFPEFPLSDEAKEKVAQADSERAQSTKPKEGDEPEEEKKLIKIGLVPASRLEPVFLAPREPNVLSSQMLSYFYTITEACVGRNEVQRNMAMNNLKQDSVVVFIMPKLSLFITETVRVNCVTKEMIYLIYAMRMVQALLENENLDIPPYLHEIIPTVVSCVVSHNFCKQPGVLNHYALRDFAAKIAGKICGAYHNSVNNIGFRVRGLYIRALERKPAQLAAIYGGVTGLAELGDAVVIRFLEPRLKEIGDTLRAFMESNGCSAADMKCALTIKELITKIMTNTLRRKLQSLWKSKPETFDTFDPEQSMDLCMAQYGHLGATIHSIVLGLRKQETADKKKLAKSLKRPHN